MPDPDSTSRPGYLGLRVGADSPTARRIVAALRAYWRAMPNGDGGPLRAPPPLWGFCPCCRGEALGVGTWPDGALRVTCWDCGADEADVAERLRAGAAAVAPRTTIRDSRITDREPPAPAVPEARPSVGGPIMPRLIPNLRRGAR